MRNKRVLKVFKSFGGIYLYIFINSAPTRMVKIKIRLVSKFIINIVSCPNYIYNTGNKI
jgi:hypothetical protein